MSDPKDGNPEEPIKEGAEPPIEEPVEFDPEASEELLHEIGNLVPDINMDDDDRFHIGTHVFREDRTGLFERVWDAWRDMRASTRRMIEEGPSEARLLFFVLISDLIFFLSWAIKIQVAPTAAINNMMPEDSAIFLVGALILRTMTVYVFALLVALGLKAIGGKGTIKDTRIGIFWGAFVASPFGLLAAVVTFLMAKAEPAMPFLGNETVSLMPLWVGLLPYVWFVSAGAAEAHKFKKVFPLFAGLSIILIVGMMTAIILRARGVLVFG